MGPIMVLIGVHKIIISSFWVNQGNNRKKKRFLMLRAMIYVIADKFDACSRN